MIFFIVLSVRKRRVNRKKKKKKWRRKCQVFKRRRRKRRVVFKRRKKVEDVPEKKEEDSQGEKEREKEPDRWSVYFDDISMKPYYYNWTTGETTWDKPKGVDLSSMGAVQTNVTTESYEAQASFRKFGGRFDAADGATHWDRTGIPSNRTDRQMSHYMDISQLEKSTNSKKRKTTSKAPNGKSWKEYNAMKKKKRAKRILES